MQTDVRHVGIHIGDVVRIIEEPFKGIRRELLAKSGAVIDLAVLVVDEGRSIDASFIVFTEQRVYAFVGKQTDKFLSVATAAVHGKGNLVPYLRLPFFALYSRAL